MARRQIDIKEFRRGIAVLKKQGLVSNIDPRKAEPGMIRGGQVLRDLVKKYDDVISGKATAIPKSKLEKADTKKYQQVKPTEKSRRWLPTKKKEPLVIVPHAADEKVIAEKGELVFRNPSGIDRVELGVPYHNLEQYLSDIAKDHKRINRMKERREFFGFRFFGHRSGMYSNDIASLIEELRHYESVETHINRQDARGMNEIFRNLEIIRFKRASGWLAAKKPGKRPGQYSHAAYMRRKKKAPMWKREQQAEVNAAAQKAYRDRIKKDPAKLAEYKANAAKRAAKSRAVKKHSIKRKKK